LGGVGEADIQAGALQDALDDSDEGDGSEVDRATAAASATSPDDIDNAVLQLLASRDRTGTPAPDEDDRPAETAAGPAFSAPASGPSTAEQPGQDEQPAPRQPRRTARTSFSSFGPPDLPVRPSTANRSESAAGAGSGPDQAETSPSEPVPEFESVTQGLAPDAVVTEAVPVEPIADEAFPQLAPVSADETADTPGAQEAVASAVAADAGRSSRSSRSSRSGTTRRVRRPAGASAEATNAPDASSPNGEAATTDAASDGGETAPRAPRRRRVRRPAGSSSGAAGEAVASEASS
jgi:hypothetical protein